MKHKRSVIFFAKPASTSRKPGRSRKDWQARTTCPCAGDMARSAGCPSAAGRHRRYVCAAASCSTVERRRVGSLPRPRRLSTVEAVKHMHTAWSSLWLLLHLEESSTSCCRQQDMCAFPPAGRGGGPGTLAAAGAQLWLTTQLWVLHITRSHRAGRELVPLLGAAAAACLVSGAASSPLAVVPLQHPAAAWDTYPQMPLLMHVMLADIFKFAINPSSNCQCFSESQAEHASLLLPMHNTDRMPAPSLPGHAAAEAPPPPPLPRLHTDHLQWSACQRSCLSAR